MNTQLLCCKQFRVCDFLFFIFLVYLFYYSYIWIVVSYFSLFLLPSCLHILPFPSSIGASMSKNASTHSITNFDTSGYVLRRNKRMKCFFQDDSVLRTVSDVNNVNYGRKFRDCRNYRNHMDKDCNFFNWLDDEFIDEMDLKLERQKKKINKFKSEVIHTELWLKISIVVGILSLRLNHVFVTIYFNQDQGNLVFCFHIINVIFY